MGAVTSVVDTVKNVVGGAVDIVKDAGSFIDDTVRDVVPGGWTTVAAVTGATMGLPTAGLGETAAATEGATGLASLGESVLPASEAFATGLELAAPAFAPSELATALSTSAPTTDYLGTQALGDVTTGAVGSTSTPSVLGEFNPANISGIGIQAPELSTLGSLGGTAAMTTGTAGLTSEQLANANAAAQVGSNASSGLGYLGGAESLPSGTAGITGVTPTTDWSRLSKGLGDLLGGQNSSNLANALYGKGNLTIGSTSIPKSNQPSFLFTQQQPIQSASTDKTGIPFLSGSPQLLANLLKG